MKQAGDARVIGIDQLAAPDFAGVDLVVMGGPNPQAIENLSEPQSFRRYCFFEQNLRS
jgi:hypothetical protein